MRLMLILAFQCLIGSALAQDEIEYPFRHDLKGPVQECSVKKFKAHFGAGKIEMGEYIEDDKFGIKAFDRDGRLIEFRTHPDAAATYEKKVITYLETGCLQEMKEYHRKGYVEGNSVYGCDAKGNVITQTDYYFVYEDRPTARITYKYDAAGRIAEMHKKSGIPKNKAAKSKSEFDEDHYEHRYNEYDKNGFLIKWTIKREGMDPELAALFSGSAEVTNDAQGRPLAEYAVNDLAAKEGKTKKLSREMTYNAEGFLSKKVDYNNLGITVTYYEYTYDDRGNWITRLERKSSDASGKDKGIPMNMIVREIKYY